MRAEQNDKRAPLRGRANDHLTVNHLQQEMEKALTTRHLQQRLNEQALGSGTQARQPGNSSSAQPQQGGGAQDGKKG